MTDPQVRMLASSIALVAGAIASTTDNLNVNVGIVIVLVSGAMFIAEYIRSRMAGSA